MWRFVCVVVALAMLSAIQVSGHDVALVNFLKNNLSPTTGMPLSFRLPDNYWVTIGSDPNNVNNTNERVLTTYGLNLYDGACWQIALVLADNSLFETEVTALTKRLLSGKSGNMGLRADDYSVFTYGIEHPYNGSYPYFFRMTSDSFVNPDPLTKEPVLWMDWKPVTGENAWLNLLGPLASYNLYLQRTGQKPVYERDEIQLAVKSLDCFLAMQSPIGAVYYAPKGTYRVPIPTEIACENNVSLYSGLTLLRALLVQLGDPEKRIPDIDKLLAGIEYFLKNHAFDRANNVYFQGGIIDSAGVFVPNPVFPLDVQTWGLSVFGEMTDSWFGVGTSFKVWQQSRSRSGVFNAAGELIGVGYTDGNQISSVEWTLGAITMCRILALQYTNTQPAFAQFLLKDAETMRAGMEAHRVTYTNGEAAYKYCSTRYYIPFGWWCNPISSVASTAWMLMVDANYNPFYITGEYLQPKPVLKMDTTLPNFSWNTTYTQ